MEPPSALADLRVLRAPGRGLYASNGPLYRSAIFGRDSLECAEDLVAHRGELAREILLTLAGLQGEDFDAVTEEEPGRIHHEYRRSEWDGRTVPEASLEILRRLSSAWGGSPDEMVYYGTADATPLFISVAARWCEAHGKGLLRERVARRSGTSVVFEDAVADAASWTVRRIEEAGAGFLCYLRSNPAGLEHQIWKDSPSGVVHPDGRRANSSRPIATIELQGLAYDGLSWAAGLVPGHPDAERWRAAADMLAERVAEAFWQPDQSWFAHALDRGPDGSWRAVRTRTSDAAVVLRSGLLDAVGPEPAGVIRRAVARGIMSPDFLTDVGVRCRSLAHGPLDASPQYHGAWASWPKETFDVAAGLRRAGFCALAAALDRRLLAAAALSGDHYEFYWVSPEGSVLYDPVEQPADVDPVTVPNRPEGKQAWTVSAALAIKRDRWVRPGEEPSPFERDVLAGVPAVPAPRTRVSAPPPAPFRLIVEPSAG